MADNTNTILLSPNSGAIRAEALADAAISPGDLVEISATGVDVNGTLDEVTPEVAVAINSVGDAGDVNRDYVMGETANFAYPQKGELVNFRIGENLAITKGQKLASAGDGTLLVATVAGSAIVKAQEAVTTGGGEEKFIICRVL